MVPEYFLIIGIMLVVVSGPSIVIGMLGHAVIKALARNPSAANKIFVGMMVMLSFVVGLSVVAMLIIFQLFGTS